jgi:hypothetical protein
MRQRDSRITALLIGATAPRARRAVGLAAGLFLAGAALEYAVLRTGFDDGLLVAIHGGFRVRDFLAGDPAVSTVIAAGNLVVLGLAAVYAYLNAGYLVSVLLGWSVAAGNLVWTVGSPTEIANLRLDPAAAFARTFPEAVVLATVGFALGFLLRRLWRTDGVGSRETVAVSGER